MPTLPVIHGSISRNAPDRAIALANVLRWGARLQPASRLPDSATRIGTISFLDTADIRGDLPLITLTPALSVAAGYITIAHTLTKISLRTATVAFPPLFTPVARQGVSGGKNWQRACRRITGSHILFRSDETRRLHGKDIPSLHGCAVIVDGEC